MQCNRRATHALVSCHSDHTASTRLLSCAQQDTITTRQPQQQQQRLASCLRPLKAWTLFHSLFGTTCTPSTAMAAPIVFSLEQQEEPKSALEEEREKHKARCGCCCCSPQPSLEANLCQQLVPLTSMHLASTAHSHNSSSSVVHQALLLPTHSHTITCTQGREVWHQLQRPSRAAQVHPAGTAAAAQTRGLCNRHRPVHRGVFRRLQGPWLVPGTLQATTAGPAHT